MTIHKKINIFSIFIAFLVLFSITPVIYCDSNTYEVGFEENSTIVWEIIDVDKDQIDYLLSVTELDENDFDYKEGDKIKYEINTISEVSEDEYYLISYDYYENDENQGAKAERIAMDPGDLAGDFEEDFELDEYTITFVLTDTEDYIDEVGNEVSDTYKPFVYTSGSSIILNGSFGSFLFWLKMDYDEHGILEEISLVYEGQEIFNMVQKSYTTSNVLPLFWLIIIGILIISAVVIVVVVLVVILTKKSKKSKQPKITAPIKPAEDVEKKQLTKTQMVSEAETKKEVPEITQYCANCGAKRDTEAAFCAYCGSKF
ncbi:MAG: zinc ribbon domain-containing protein [Promethearchaeota archaeon]